ncbi:MAG: PEP-CTERM-box response regulator transcription factor [Rhodospirillaceae bacterium]
MEDDAGLQQQMRWALSDEFVVHLAENRAAAMAIVSLHAPPLVVLDLGLPPDAAGASEGIATLEQIMEQTPGAKVIVASGSADRANAMKAIAAGAYDYFSKPVDIAELKLILERAWQLHTLEEDNRKLTQVARGPIEGIVAASGVMLDICRLVERAAPSDVSLLILGESGTGKEVIARALHRLSERKSGPFVAVNCAAIPDALLESELFGHEKGAFTGAIRQTKGKVEQARGGTLFLDEIGDMPLPLQAKLLRFLQERTLQRVGGSEDIVVDLRVVSASNRDIQAMIAEGTFREDLYFRINEVKVVIPPLRARPGDAVLIAYTLLQRFAQIYKKGQLEFSPGALATIARYAWPGNVRELENRVKRAVVLAHGTRITAADMDLSNSVVEEGEAISLKEVRRQAELEALKRALKSCNNNLSQVARVLGVSRPTLYSMLRTYEIKIVIK